MGKKEDDEKKALRDAELVEEYAPDSKTRKEASQLLDENNPNITEEQKQIARRTQEDTRGQTVSQATEGGSQILSGQFVKDSEHYRAAQDAQREEDWKNGTFPAPNAENERARRVVQIIGVRTDGTQTDKVLQVKTLGNDIIDRTAVKKLLEGHTPIVAQDESGNLKTIGKDESGLESLKHLHRF